MAEPRKPGAPMPGARPGQSGADDATAPGEAVQLLAAAEALGLPLKQAQIEAMGRYLTLLRRWNATYNLTAVRVPQAMLSQHLADCLAAVAALNRRGVLPVGARILDAGSGGGLPGVLIALLHPEWSVTCIDAVGKKVAFVRQVAGTLALANLAAAHARLETWCAGTFDLVTARAFASLADLTRLTEPLLAHGGCWMAMKGQVPAGEIAELPPDIDVFHVEQLNVPGLDAQRCLVWMRRRRDLPAA